MGITVKSFIVKHHRNAKKKMEINFLFDSGAVYSLVPSNELKKLGIAPYRTVEFILADGSKIERKVGGLF